MNRRESYSTSREFDGHSGCKKHHLHVGWRDVARWGGKEVIKTIDC